MYNHIRMRVAGWAALVAAAAMGVPSTSSLCTKCQEGTACLQECPCSHTACAASCNESACAATGCCGKQVCDGTACAACCEDAAATCASPVAYPLVAGAMSGCASFLRESDQELAAQREVLARDLAGYLATRPHAHEHVCQLLNMALDSVADDAHRAAMKSQFSANFVLPVPASPAPQPECTDLEQMRSALAEQQQRLDRLEENMFALARHVGDHEAPARECGVPMPGGGFTKARIPMPCPSDQMTTTREVAVPVPGKDRLFTVVRVPMPCPACPTCPPAQMTPETEMLKQRIAQLEEQLNSVRGRPLASGVSGHVGDHVAIPLQTAPVRTSAPFPMKGVSSPVPAGPASVPAPQMEGRSMLIPLTPAEPSAAMPGQPVLQPTTWHSTTVPPTGKSAVFTVAPAQLVPMVERTYYVGDLLSPPYPTGIMRLMQLIKMTVEPESWEHASIEIVSPAVSLRIHQSAENHEKISQVLHLLRPQAINQ